MDSEERFQSAKTISNAQALVAGIKLVTMKTPAVVDDSDYDWHVEGNRWIDKTGKVKWPENDGFDGDIEKVTLTPGTKIDISNILKEAPFYD